MIAYKGETVTCENGHVICDVADDINRYSGAKAELFTDWHMDLTSDDGQPMPCRCVVCGAEFIRPMSLEPSPPPRTGLQCLRPWLTEAEFAYMSRGLQLHIGNVWRR
ncbi:hypothetical protein [Microvirga yunnanensis]|uniref:hypothetical protein n=1 Tax=Microvirga yunnanensis TaxID=2953740 RepID=UPI0021C92567|nr:hypothetical protein [Microvirga sp. HBU65207]